MMKGVAIAIGVFVSALACAGVKEEIQAQYDRFAKAYVKNDVKVILDILSPDYVLVDVAKQETSYAQYKAKLEKRKDEGATSKAYKVKIVSLKATGNEVAMETLEIMTTNTNSKIEHRYQDSWRKTESGWRLYKTVAIAH